MDRDTKVQMLAASESQRLCDEIASLGYTEARVLPDGSIAMIGDLLTTTAVYLGGTACGWERRYCFADSDLARLRFLELQSEDDEPQGWIARRPENPCGRGYDLAARRDTSGNAATGRGEVSSRAVALSAPEGVPRTITVPVGNGYGSSYRRHGYGSDD
jgi:hypothetical protein